MFKGNSKQDGRGYVLTRNTSCDPTRTQRLPNNGNADCETIKRPDMEVDGLSNEIIDIRHDSKSSPLSETLRDSLQGGQGGSDDPAFPSLLLWDEKGLRLFEEITYSEDYYLTNTEIEILKEYRYESPSLLFLLMIFRRTSGHVTKSSA